MEDVPLPVDLDRRPVGVHLGDLAAGDAPHQTGTVEVIQRARWMTSEQGVGIPAEAGGTLGPATVPMEELVTVAEEKPPMMLRYSGMCR